MNIWIINEYAGSPYHGNVFRHYYLAKNWLKLGHDVTIVSSTYSHLFKKLPSSEKHYNFEDYEGIHYTWVKVPKYKESKDFRRILKWFIFTLKLYFLPIKKMSKPDVIIYSGTAPFSIFPSLKLKKKFNAKLIFEVRDIWPLSIIELGGVSPNHPLIKLMSFAEKNAIIHSDLVVSNLQNYSSHIKQLGLENNFEWISNGVELEELRNTKPILEDVKNQIPKDKFVVGYTGTVGIANTLDSFCEAAIKLVNNKEIVFVIVGDGRNKENILQKYGHLDNLIFINPIPKIQVQSMLALFDACYIGLRKEKLFEFGVSPNKLFDYMYSGKPILYAINSGENIVDISNCGISVEAMNSEAISEAVLKLFTMEQEEREKLGANGKDYVLNHFTYEKLAKKYDSYF